MRFFEVVYGTKPRIRHLCDYESKNPQDGVIVMPTLGINILANELTRLFKFYANGFCEVIPITYTRLEQGFSEDREPSNREPSVTVKDWMSGIDAHPILVNLVLFHDDLFIF